MKLCSCNREYTARVAELATEVLPGDPGNREGIAAKHTERLKKHLPPKGSVRVLQITEKQYNAMKILVGEKTATEDFLTPRDFVEL